MDDALVVRGRERVGQRVGDVEDPLDRQAPLGNGAVEGLALDELHGEEVDAPVLLDRKDRDDARVIEGGEGLRLAAEAVQAVGTSGHPGGQHLERHIASELRVGGAIHLAHSTDTDGGGEPIVGECASDHRASFGGCQRQHSRGVLRGRTRGGGGPLAGTGGVSAFTRGCQSGNHITRCGPTQPLRGRRAC